MTDRPDIAENKQKRRQQLQNMMIDHEYRTKGFDGIKKDLFDKDMQQLTQEMQQNLIQIALKKEKLENKSKRKHQFNMESYLKKLQSSDYLYKTFKQSLEQQDYHQAIQLQQVLQAKFNVQQTNIDALIKSQKSQNHTLNDYQILNDHRQLVENQVVSKNDQPHHSVDSNQQYQELATSCGKIMKSNKFFMKSINKSKIKNRSCYLKLNNQFNKFQQQCEIGDNIEGLQSD